MNTSVHPTVSCFMAMDLEVFPTIVDFTNSGFSQLDSSHVDQNVEAPFVLVCNFNCDLLYFTLILKKDQEVDQGKNEEEKIKKLHTTPNLT